MPASREPAPAKKSLSFPTKTVGLGGVGATLAGVALLAVNPLAGVVLAGAGLFGVGAAIIHAVKSESFSFFNR